jgi:hypothetical protein
MPNNIEVLYYLRDAVACLGVLVGLGGAVFLLIRKKTLPAILALIGFILLGVEPLLDVLIWRILANNSSANYDTLNTAYACITGPALFLAILLIVLAFILGLREPKIPPPPIESPADLPPVV